MTPTAHDAGVDDASVPTASVPTASVPTASVPTASVSTAAHEVQDMPAVLRCLADRPLDEHAEVYQALHASLHAALAEIDGT